MPRSKNSKLNAYVDPKDLSASTARLLIWEALQKYSVKALIAMLKDADVVVRTAAARLLQLRGGSAAWAATKELCQGKKISEKIIGLFILGQLGTPRLPYKQQSLELIYSLLRRRPHVLVIEQALYSIGHLRQGRALEHEGLARRIYELHARRGTDLAAAKAFALRS